MFGKDKALERRLQEIEAANAKTVMAIVSVIEAMSKTARLAADGSVDELKGFSAELDKAAMASKAILALGGYK